MDYLTQPTVSGHRHRKPPLHLALGEVAVDNDADLTRCCCYLLLLFCRRLVFVC